MSRASTSSCSMIVIQVLFFGWFMLYFPDCGTPVFSSLADRWLTGLQLINPLHHPPPIQNTILFLILPMFSILTSTISPFPRKQLGFINQPTPAGVPVIHTVPARTVRPLVRCTMIWLMLHIILDVLSFCLISPLTLVVNCNLCGFPIAAGDTI